MIARDQRKGFSLAELLVTLTIVGTIATLVIPPIVVSVQNEMYKQEWRKKFSELSQVTYRIMADNGGTLIGAFTDAAAIRSKYLNHLSYIQEGDAGYTPIYQLNKVVSPYFFDWATSMLSDGTLLKYQLDSTSCFNGTDRCGWLLIDVNGSKPPNTIGRDVFQINIMKDGLKPFGYRSGEENTCASNKSGESCAMEYILK